jgi:peptidoglycan/LPS O-acetylase OafA/YrhL
MPPTRLHYLDGVRGLAALVVFATHLSLVVFPSLFNGMASMARLRWEWLLAGTPLGLLWAANFAVCIFFVLSAIVLGSFYEREGDDFIANVVRRYIRLTIPIFAASLVAYLLWKSVGMHNIEAREITQEGWLKEFYQVRPHFSNVFVESFYGIFRTPHSELNPVLWTMKYELEGSIGIFLLYALVPSRPARSIVLTIGLILAFRTYYFCFVGGALIYEWSKIPEPVRDRYPRWIGWACLVVGAYAGSFPYNLATPENPWYSKMLFLDVETWHTIGATWFVFGVVTIAEARNAFASRPFRYLGQISFSLYLIHVPLIGSLMTLFIVRFYVPPHDTIIIILAAVLIVPVVLMCADLMNRFVDVPSVRLSRAVGRFLASGLVRTQSVSAASPAE